jgi:hypothetical protein
VGVGVELDFAGRVIVLFGGRCDVVVDAGCASSCLRKLPVLSFVVGVAFGAAEVLGLDWTSSCGEMSSNWCFLKVDWGLGILQWFETAADKGQLVFYKEG